MTKGKLLAVVVVWLIIFGIGAAAWRFVVQPYRDRTEAKQQRERLDIGSSDSRYKHQLNFALDSFSGYAILRSEEFREQLAKRGIKINLQDDKANYNQRLQSLDKGDVQMAAFTIDALVKASAQLGDLSASIVAVVDETIGADAMVAYKDVIRNVDDLNQPDVRFVLTPDSPSETLARVVMAHFNLDRLPENPFVETRDAADAYDNYKRSKPDTPQVFVLWEPYVSKILENPDTHVVVDSKGFQGYIVDVIVVSRDYLAKNHDVVRDVVACYFRAAYTYRSKMVDLVKQDAQALKTPLTDKQAKTLSGRSVVEKHSGKLRAFRHARRGVTATHRGHHQQDHRRPAIHRRDHRRSDRRSTEPAVLRQSPPRTKRLGFPSGACRRGRARRHRRFALVERHAVAAA